MIKSNNKLKLSKHDYEILNIENLSTYLFAQFIHYNITDKNFVSFNKDKVVFYNNNKFTSAIPSKISRLLSVAFIFQLEECLKQFDELSDNKYVHLDKEFCNFALNKICDYIKDLK